MNIEMSMNRLPMKNIVEKEIKVPSILISFCDEDEAGVDHNEVIEARQIRYLYCFPLLTFCLNDEARLAFRGIERILAAFGQGLRLSKTSFAFAYSQVRKFHSLIPM